MPPQPEEHDKDDDYFENARKGNHTWLEGAGQTVYLRDAEFEVYDTGTQPPTETTHQGLKLKIKLDKGYDMNVKSGKFVEEK
ncbi:hypothetical protein JX265_013871 [Neoarthrinium moseri]|uniref:Uncharacterized protein n=1 Tax=Neoarthrinium moseri TaxID=1658444 RepID=A0A9Q0AH81_9PEZI|nr:hypothetical protein JX265_013871 [Neoarthrinium moseri]